MQTLWCAFILGLVALGHAETMAPALEMDIASLQPTSISIKWNITDYNNTVASYKIYANDSSSAYHVTMSGSDLIDTEKREATIHVREPGVDYTVCLEAILTQTAKAELGENVVACKDTATIKVIRTSSILALVGVIAFFLLLVLVGLCAWKCASRGKGAEHDYEKSDVNGNGDIVPLTQIED